MFNSLALSLRNRGIISGILSGLLGRGMALIAPFIILPEMLRYLGDGQFGVWMTAVSITSMAMFVDFGIGNGLLTHLSHAYANNDNKKMRSYITSAYVALTVISLSAVALILVGSFFAGNWISWQIARENADSKNIVIVTLLAFAFGVPLSIIQRVMYACQKSALSNLWQLLGAVASVIFCYLAIQLKMPVWAVVSVYAFAPLGILFLATILFFRNNPELRPGAYFLSKVRALELMRLGSKFFLLSIITSISLNSDNLIITLRAGAIAVAEYAVAAKLASILALIVTTAFLPLWAANGEAFAKKDLEWIKKTSLRMSFLGGCGLAAAGALLAVLSNFIVLHWMGRKFTGITEVMAGWAIFYTLLGIASPFNMILNAVGSVRVQIKVWGCFLAVTLLAKYFVLINSSDLWLVPLVSAFAYLFIILPVSIRFASQIFNGNSAGDNKLVRAE